MDKPLEDYINRMKAQNKDVEILTGPEALLFASFNKSKRNKDHGGVTRFLNEGDIIEFTNVKFTFRNAEFEINHDPNTRIWFSQLTELFFNPFVKDERYYGQTWISRYFHMNPNGFWEYVQGKRFKVTIDNTFRYIFDKNHEKYDTFTEYDEMKDYFLTNFHNKNYEAIKGMLKATPCYALNEI